MTKALCTAFSVLLITCASTSPAVLAQVGVGVPPPTNAEVLFDGSEEMLHDKWTYWEGPRFAAELPIKWRVLPDPVDDGMALSTKDSAATTYGQADIVTKKAYGDFRLHVEFLVTEERGNSGVYLQNRYEIQIVEGEEGPHGMAAVINEAEAPYELFNGIGKWNAYDILFRAARFDENGERTQRALVTMYFNGVKVHENQPINKVWGGANSGVDGGRDGGLGITDTPQGLKLQAEGHDVRYRNLWIQELDLAEPDTDF